MFKESFVVKSFNFQRILIDKHMFLLINEINLCIQKLQKANKYKLPFLEIKLNTTPTSVKMYPFRKDELGTR